MKYKYYDNRYKLTQTVYIFTHFYTLYTFILSFLCQLVEAVDAFSLS